MSQIHYLPLTPGFFGILVGIFVIVLILRSVRYAYESLALLWQILGGAGFPNQFFCDSWVVGFWRGRPWLTGRWIGETSLGVG